MGIHAENKIFSYKDLRDWPQNERWELYAGEAIAMSAPTRKHQAIVGYTFRKIAAYIDSTKCKIYTAPFDVRFPETNERDDAITTVLQPDITIVCDEKKLDLKGCRGAPDVIFEILSPETEKSDQTTKLKIYEKAGVNEYWILHPKDQIAFQLVLKDGLYKDALVFSHDDAPHMFTFPEFALPLNEIFAAE